jgi:general secretion pathway protein I
MRTEFRLVRSGRRDAGFGLLEAIVALALLGGSGVALMAWVQQSWATVSRVSEREARARLLIDARRLASAINPARRADGEIDAGALKLRWLATLAQPVRPSVPTVANEQVRWLVGLYRVEVQAEDRSRGVRVEFELMLPGTQQVLSRDTRNVETP